MFNNDLPCCLRPGVQRVYDSDEQRLARACVRAALSFFS